MRRKLYLLSLLLAFSGGVAADTLYYAHPSEAGDDFHHYGYRNEAVEQARAAYLEASQNQDISRSVPFALTGAAQYLREAEQTYDRDQASHLAYLAQRRVDAAHALVDERHAQRKLAEYLGQREAILQQVRAQEMERLQRELARQAARLEAETEAAKPTSENHTPAPVKAPVPAKKSMAAMVHDELKPEERRTLYQLLTLLKTHAADRAQPVKAGTVGKDAGGTDDENEEPE